MATPTPESLSRRERQVLDALYRLRSASVSELVEVVAGAPTYAAVRAALGTLREKKLVQYRVDGARYIYFPALPADRARRRALDHVVRTFFDGSAVAAAAALLGVEGVELTDEAVEGLRTRIAKAREEGR